MYTTKTVVSFKIDVIVTELHKYASKNLYRFSMHFFLISVFRSLIHISKTRAIHALVQCRTNQNEGDL